MNYVDLRKFVTDGNLNDKIKITICNDNVTDEIKRYASLLDEAYKLYGDGDYHYISSPGRSEIGGNHTDHQHGHVVCAALNIDNLCVVKARNDMIATFYDPSFKEIKVDLNNLDIVPEEKNTSESLIRGIAARCKELGYKIQGFDAICDSRVLVGSGISSSACFEVMVVEIFNALFNEDKINPVLRAQISQYAENVYYMKPSGLLDQLAISVGGFTAIDFKDNENPKIESYDFSFDSNGYELVLVDVKGDHADLSHEYAAVPNEIKDVDHYFGVEFLADLDPKKFYDNIKEVRETIKNDRAITRSIHFYNEDRRAKEEALAIKNKNMDELLKLMNESGRSSFMYLQNVYPASLPSNQPVSVALALTDNFLKGEGAFRVHGGGFGGTIQVIVKKEKLEEYKTYMSAVFDSDALQVVRVRRTGTELII